MVSTRSQSLEKQRTRFHRPTLRPALFGCREWPVKMAIIHTQWRFLAEPQTSRTRNFIKSHDLNLL
jgi:hypothetical protein